MPSTLELPAVRTHRFTRERYERMVEAGIFGASDRVELLDGEIVETSPQRSRHATAVTLVADRLSLIARAIGGCLVRAQLPLALGTESEPEPDAAVVDGTARDYRDRHPTTARLVVEVSDTSLAYDRGRKLAAYARAGIVEYWVLDLPGAALEVYRKPSGERYGEVLRLAAGEQVRWSGYDIDVGELLP